MKLPKALNNAAVQLGMKPPPRRRGLGKKTLAKMANSQALVVAPTPNGQVRKVAPNLKLLQRAYKEVAAVGGINSDWAVNAIGEDSDIWQNIFLLRQRSRDLFRTDAIFAKYREELWANCFGSNGITLRMNIKEDDDRAIKSMQERSFRRAYNRRVARVNDHRQRKYGTKTSFRQVEDEIAYSGEKNVFANHLIENAWCDWQRREFCTMAGRLNYKEVRYVRILSAARDGDFFLRHVRDPKVNKYGYSLHLINSEWCDFYLNVATPQGREIRMGIERDKYGRNQVYYFIQRQPMDWQFAIPGAFNYSSARMHEQVKAEDIIHYARYVDGDSTRPAPWSAPVIPKSRHLDKYEEAEVVAARVAACKMGFFTSNVIPEGGQLVGEMPDPTQSNTLEAEPGQFQGLEWGVGVEAIDFKHPNQNFPAFRKEMLRSWCAGMPGANYNIVANDLEGVNYSSGRLGMLDERELWKMLQTFDIDIAERPIFENWLEMALLTGAIPLPLAQFDQLNKPIFRGRRWAWVDPFKEVQASAMQVANKFTSRTRVIEDSDVDADFEEILFELAEEEMLMDELGMDSTPVVGKVSPTRPAEDVGSEDEENDPNSPSNKAIEMVKIPKGYLEAPPTQILIQNNRGEEMKLTDLIQLLAATRQTSNPAITVNVPPPTVNIENLRVPEQKTPIVNFTPVVNVPEQRTPDVKVDVAPPTVTVEAPQVHVRNEVKIPKTKIAKIKRGKDGKMSSIEVETDG